jgi:hypothetical protein
MGPVYSPLLTLQKTKSLPSKAATLLTEKLCAKKITPRLGPVEIQIDDDLFIAPLTDEERELAMLYSNHSCNANLGVRGEITLSPCARSTLAKN